MKYTAIFKKEEIGYSVSFPAIDGCFTEGDTKEKAIASATEALALTLKTHMSINPYFELPADKNNYDLEDGDFTQLIEVKISPVGDRWEDVRKELYSPEERKILDKKVDKINEQINKSNH